MRRCHKSEQRGLTKCSGFRNYGAMNDLPLIAASPQLTVADLRAELGVSLERFAEMIGLGSKSGAFRVEHGELVSLDVALRIEALSMVEGIARIDAAILNDGVRAARAACRGGCADTDGLPDYHSPAITPSSAPPATGQNGELSGERPFETGKSPPQGERERVA